MLPDNFMRNRVPGEGNRSQFSARCLDRLANGLRDFVRLPRREANATLTVVPQQTANINYYRAAVNAEASLLAYFPVDGDVGGTVSNYGAIGGAGSRDGVNMRNGGIVFNHQAGHITGASNGVEIANARFYFDET